MPEPRTGEAVTGMGMTLGGSSRLGWWERRGVPGGGGMRANSAAREDSGVCLEESVMRRLVSSARRPTRDWGVMSAAYAARWMRGG